MNNELSVAIVKANIGAMAELGGWQDVAEELELMLKRIPTDDKPSAGLDAGLAAALCLIPSEKSRLTAILHGYYTEEAIQQVRRETVDWDADSETVWWLAMSYLCDEDRSVSVKEFHDQLMMAQIMASHPEVRLEKAKIEFERIAKRYKLVDGIPFVIKDGGLQGAYLHGLNWGVQYGEAYGIFFLGTFQPSLGLEDFKFSDRMSDDDPPRPMSGLVGKRPNFAKVSSFRELADAIDAITALLGKP